MSVLIASYEEEQAYRMIVRVLVKAFHLRKLLSSTTREKRLQI